MNEDKKIAIVPGSFDPITFGHLNIIKRAAIDHDKVYLAVMINPNKSYMFTISQRERIAKVAVTGMDKVEVISSEGMLWELARDLGAVSIVKGYRNETDLAYENDMAEYNSTRYPQAKTLLYKADEALCDISSTLVREKIRDGEALEGVLPEKVIKEINKIIDEQ